MWKTVEHETMQKKEQGTRHIHNTLKTYISTHTHTGEINVCADNEHASAFLLEC